MADVRAGVVPLIAGVGKKRKSSPAKSPMASKKQKLAHGDDSTVSLSPEKEYSEVKTDIKYLDKKIEDHEKKIDDLQKKIDDLQRKIKQLVEDYYDLLGRSDLTACEMYRKANFERNLAELKKDKDKLEKDKDFWMGQMKSNAETRQLHSQKMQSSESETERTPPKVVPPKHDDLSPEKEYLEVKTDIKYLDKKIEDRENKIDDLQRKIEQLEEDYYDLLGRSDLTACEMYRKANFERKLAELKKDKDDLKKDKDKLEKDKDFWMGQMKSNAETRQLHSQKMQSSESETERTPPKVVPPKHDDLSPEKEYLEVKTDIKYLDKKIEDRENKIDDLQRKIEQLEEDYYDLLGRSDLTACEMYRKANFERKLAELKKDKDDLKKDKDKLEKDKDFWMGQMKSNAETRQLHSQKMQSSESETERTPPKVVPPKHDDLSPEKEYLEVKTDIKYLDKKIEDRENKIDDLQRKIDDLQRKIEQLEEDYYDLLGRSDLTSCEIYRKDNLERKLAELKKDKDDLKKDKDDLKKDKDDLKKDKDKLEKDRDFWMGQLKIHAETRQLESIKKGHPLSSQVDFFKSYMSNGINMNYPYFKRTLLLENVMRSIKKERITLLCSPAASGKTALLHMLLAEKEIVCIYCSCYEKNFCTSSLLKGIVHDVKGKIYDLNKIKHFCVVMIDDAQLKYDNISNVEFWPPFIKNVGTHFPSNINFLLAATHRLDCRHESPVELSTVFRFSREKFLLSEDEARDFLTDDETGLPMNIRNDDLVELVIKDCAGLIGALTITVALLEHHFYIPYEEPKLVEIYDYYTSEIFLDNMLRCFGARPSLTINKDVQWWLIQCLCEPIFAPKNIKPEEEEVLLFLQKSGMLVEKNKNDVIQFSSPLAKRYFSRYIFPDRATSLPESIDDLVQNIIRNMPAKALRDSRLDVLTFPKEATFQHYFLLGLLKFTPPIVTLCPEHSAYTDDKKRVIGSIDFFIDGNLRWGFELLVNGKGINEHIKRCTSGGKYFSIGMKDFVVVNFCPHNENGIKQIDENLITVMFDPDYSKCRYKYGEKEVISLTLKA